jgi:outer membrane lipoprotein SlyB
MNAMRTTVAAVLLGASLTGGVMAQALGGADGGGVAQPSPAPANPSPASVQNRGVCADCGVVQSVRAVEQQGQASGVGAVAGGVIGGVLGHQVGSGRGNTVATIAGAGAGAYAGHQVEKSTNKKTSWTVTLRMDDGRTRSFTYSAQPTVREGDRVKLVDGGKRLALVTG